MIVIALIGYIESCRLEGKKIGTLRSSLVLFVFLFTSLIRAEAVIVILVFYIISLFIFRRFYRASLSFLAISLVVFFSFNAIMYFFASEAKQVFIYKEKQILDRGNFAFESLDEQNQLTLEAFLVHGYMDEDLFKMDFYDTISKYTSVSKWEKFLIQFNPNVFKKALEHSINHSQSAWPYALLIVVLTGLIVLHFKSFKHQYILFLLFALLFPVLLCFYSLVPLRFLVPYFTGVIASAVFIALKLNISPKVLSILLGITLVPILINAHIAKHRYLQKDASFKEISNEIADANAQQSSAQPIFPNSTFRKAPKAKCLIFKFLLSSILRFLPKKLESCL